MSGSSPAQRPLHGDVMVRRAAASDPVFVLSRYGGGDQFSYRSYDEAMAAACSFASGERVDVWYLDEPAPIALIAAYRAPEIAG